MKNYLEEVCIMFLVAGHTMNTADRLFHLFKKEYRSENVFSLTKRIKVCNINHYNNNVCGRIFITVILCLTKVFRVKLDANKKYQLFESCYENADTVQCQLSSLADIVTYDNNFLQPMTVQAQQKMYSSNPTSSTRNA